MKRRKVWLILMLPLMMELLVSCCDCQDPLISDYTHCSMEISSLDNSGEIPVATNETSLSKNAFGIRISILQSEKVCQRPMNDWSFISSAHAFSCDCPPEFEFRPLDKVQGVSIFSVYDFDQEHSAGANVSDLFSVYDGFTFTSISDFLEEFNHDLYYEVPFSSDVDLLLMTPPNAENQQQFTVRVELSDGRVFELNTSILELN